MLKELHEELLARVENIDIQLGSQPLTFTMPRNYEDKYG